MAATATIASSPAAETIACEVVVARGGRGADRLNSGVGNDTVIVSRADGKVDSIDCGSGVDRAAIHSEDNEVNCEDVKVIS
jgi:hypothetical protein